MFEDKFNFSIIYFCIIYIYIVIVICFDVTVDQQSWFPYNERDIVIYTFLVIKFACNIDNCKFER